MYNKLFTKILDSSIWLETDSTRLVWLTLIAVMDEHGFVQFASVANLAHRARVSLEAGIEAVRILEGPDENSSDPEHEGRRIERVPGGWIILNAPKYREIVTRAVMQEKTRLRVQKFRTKGKVTPVTECNGHVTPVKRSETPSEADTEATTEPIKAVGRAKPLPDAEWLASLAKDEAYAGIDVTREVAKCRIWSETKRKPFSRGRIVNWLNGVERIVADPNGHVRDQLSIDRMNSIR